MINAGSIFCPQPRVSFLELDATFEATFEAVETNCLQWKMKPKVTKSDGLLHLK